MDSYTNTLIRTIGKVYQLPAKASAAYENLYNVIYRTLVGMQTNQVDRQQAMDALYPLLLKLNKLPLRDDRPEERISTIIKLLESKKYNPITPGGSPGFTPKSVLDIGAGTTDITSAIKNYYKLESRDVFAIDQKLPNTVEVTPLVYVDGKIPLPDNSINLIVMFVVLHHIPPDIRPSIISEAARVLTPGGYFIIREHDDNGDPNFYIFLDLLHLFWYIVRGETVDPLYLLSRAATHDLFAKFGLTSVEYVTYPGTIPNPQRLYHEMYTKPLDPQKVSYQFANPQVKNHLQSYVNKIRLAPRSYDSLMEVLPLSMRTQIQNKYGVALITTPDKFWDEIIKDTALSLIMASVKYVPMTPSGNLGFMISTNGVYYITISAINSAAVEMGWP